MPKCRLGTFNCENLFARFKFNKNIDPAKISKKNKRGRPLAKSPQVDNKVPANIVGK